jgi:hypothetical protein
MLFKVVLSTTEPVMMLMVSVVLPMPTSATFTGIVPAAAGVAVAVGEAAGVAVAVPFVVGVVVVFAVGLAAGVAVPFVVAVGVPLPAVAVAAAVGLAAGVGVATGVSLRVVFVVLGSLLNRLSMSLAFGETPFWKPVATATVACGLRGRL